jgi:hypothetical protein
MAGALVKRPQKCHAYEECGFGKGGTHDEIIHCPQVLGILGHERYTPSLLAYLLVYELHRSGPSPQKKVNKHEREKSSLREPAKTRPAMNGFPLEQIRRGYLVFPTATARPTVTFTIQNLSTSGTKNTREIFIDSSNICNARTAFSEVFPGWLGNRGK